MENSSSKKREKFFLLLTIVFAVLSAYLGYELKNAKENIQYITVESDQLEVEKQAVEQELEDMLVQYDTLQIENEEMRLKVEIQKQKIEELITKAKNNNWTIHKLKKETETLRTIMKGYIYTIDSLNTANLELIAEKKVVEGKLSQQKKNNSVLSEKNKDLADKVKVGSKLEALDMLAYAQRVKGNNIHRETNRAEKADKIKCCFTLDNNPIAKAGKRDVYIRIIDPNGAVLSLSEDKNNMFRYDGIDGLYSIKQEVLYENEELDLCLYWTVNDDDPLMEGEYLLECYVEDYLAGTTAILLK